MEGTKEHALLCGHRTVIDSSWPFVADVTVTSGLRARENSRYGGSRRTKEAVDAGRKESPDR